MEDEPNTVKNGNKSSKNKSHEFFLSFFPYIGGIAGLIAIISVVHSITQWGDDLEQRLKQVEKSDVAIATTSTQQQIQVLNRDILSRISELEQRVKLLEDNKNAAIHSAISPPPILPASGNPETAATSCQPFKQDAPPLAAQEPPIKACMPSCARQGVTDTCTIKFINDGDEEISLFFGRKDDNTAYSARIFTDRSNYANARHILVGDGNGNNDVATLQQGQPLTVSYEFPRTQDVKALNAEDYVSTMDIDLWFFRGPPPAYSVISGSIEINNIKITR